MRNSKLSPENVKKNFKLSNFLLTDTKELADILLNHPVTGYTITMTYNNDSQEEVFFSLNGDYKKLVDETEYKFAQLDLELKESGVKH